MARVTKGEPTPEPQAEADAPEAEAQGVGQIETAAAAPVGRSLAELIEGGFVGVHEAKDFMCVLGRRAVAPSHSCMGHNCMAWRGGYTPYDAPDREYGYCGLVVRP